VNLEKFNEWLKEMTTMLEDVAIERSYLWDLALAVTPRGEAELSQSLAQARQDPVYRKWAHEKFADAWKALEEMGKNALFEAHILDTPPTDKPN